LFLVTRCVAYCRASTDQQDQSIPTQEAIIARECEAKGYTLVDTYRDPGVSAGQPVEKRPAGSELIKAVGRKGKEFDAIIVVRLDRMFRNPVDELGVLAYFSKHDCQLISISDPIDDSSPTGKLLHGIMMHVRQFERQQTGLRIYDHHLVAFRQGHWTGGPRSLGLTWVKAPKPSKGYFITNDRAEDVPRVYETYIKLNGNAGATSRELNRLGIRPLHKEFWSVNTVLSTLRNPAYRRQLVFAGMRQDAPEIIPAIVDPALIGQADKLLEDARRRGYNRPSPVPAEAACYSGLVTCSECGAGMVLNGHADPVKQWYAGYTCGRRRRHGRGVCDSYQISARYVDTLMGHALARILRSVQAEILAAAKKQKPTRRVTNNGSLSRAKEARRRTVDIYTRGLITDSDFEERLRQLDAEIADIKAAPAQTPIALPAQVVAMLKTFEARWNDVPGDEKRGLMLQLGIRAVMSTGGGPDIWLEVRSDITETIVRASGMSRNRWGVKCIKCCAL
jgi:site-specific DNA recombinase